MGKIRMKTLGVDDLEQKQAEDAKKRRDAKREKKAEEAEVVSVQESEPVTEVAPSTDKKAEKKSSKKKAAPIVQKHHNGKKYKASKAKVDDSKVYAIADAVALVKEMSYVAFPETVELHLNLKEGSVKGEVTLPHGTGKEVRAVVATDALIKDIEAGKIEFDILIATPAMMPQLVKFAKVLGPKGLMPNPKTGTVTDKPEEAVKKFKGGAVRYSTEAKFPLMHQAVGKASFENKQLVENIEAMLEAVKKKNIVSAYISGTMTPSVQIAVN